MCRQQLLLKPTLLKSQSRYLYIWVAFPLSKTLLQGSPSSLFRDSDFCCDFDFMKESISTFHTNPHKPPIFLLPCNPKSRGTFGCRERESNGNGGKWIVKGGLGRTGSVLMILTLLVTGFDDLYERNVTAGPF